MLAVRIITIGLAGLCASLAPVACALAQTESKPSVDVRIDTRDLLRRAEARLAGNDAAGAYALLSPYEAMLAGNAYYDYLLGVASLDTGRTSEAIFTLSRALAVEPRFSGAKMELARAYFEAGNHDQARPLFVALLDERPPPGVRDVLNRYITAIDARPARPAPRFAPYVEVGGGYDSNANGSTDSAQFLGFTLSPQNVETESPFTEIAAGFRWTVPASAQSAWYSGARVSYRHNPDADFVDSAVLSALGGFSWRRGAFFGRAGLDGYRANRDGNFNQSYAGGEVVLGTSLTPQWEWSFGLRAGSLRHDDPIDVLDVDRLLYTLGIAYRFSSLAVVSLEGIGGDDDERVAGAPYGNSKAGARLSLSAPLGRHQLRVSIGSLTSDYDGLFFGSPREDTQVTGLAELEFRNVGIDGLSVVPRVRFVDNDSDVSLYDYDRTEFGLTFRWMPR